MTSPSERLVCPRCGYERTIRAGRQVKHGGLCQDCVWVAWDLKELEVWAA